MIFIILLPFLLFPVIDAQTVQAKLEFVSTFRCRYPGKWCIEVEYTEAFNDDVLGKVDYQCTYSPTRTLFTNAVLSTPVRRRPYRIIMTATHNCTAGDLGSLTFEERYKKVSIYEKNVRLTYDEDITV